MDCESLFPHHCETCTDAMGGACSVAVVKKYTPASGGLAEQYDRNTGAALSARDLTW